MARGPHGQSTAAWFTDAPDMDFPIPTDEPFTAEETIAGFTRHLESHDHMFRLVSNGVKHKQMAAMANFYCISNKSGRDISVNTTCRKVLKAMRDRNYQIVKDVSVAFDLDNDWADVTLQQGSKWTQTDHDHEDIKSLPGATPNGRPFNPTDLTFDGAKPQGQHRWRKNVRTAPVSVDMSIRDAMRRLKRWPSIEAGGGLNLVRVFQYAMRFPRNAHGEEWLLNRDYKVILALIGGGLRVRDKNLDRQAAQRFGRRQARPMYADQNLHYQHRTVRNAPAPGSRRYTVIVDAFAGCSAGAAVIRAKQRMVVIASQAAQVARNQADTTSVLNATAPSPRMRYRQIAAQASAALPAQGPGLQVPAQAGNGDPLQAMILLATAPHRSAVPNVSASQAAGPRHTVSQTQPGFLLQPVNQGATNHAINFTSPLSDNMLPTGQSFESHLVTPQDRDDSRTVADSETQYNAIPKSRRMNTGRIIKPNQQKAKASTRRTELQRTGQLLDRRAPPEGSYNQLPSRGFEGNVATPFPGQTREFFLQNPRHDAPSTPLNQGYRNGPALSANALQGFGDLGQSFVTYGPLLGGVHQSFVPFATFQGTYSQGFMPSGSLKGNVESNTNGSMFQGQANGVEDLNFTFNNA